MKIAIINGPNLNFLGIREPEIYGDATLETLIISLQNSFENIEFLFFQSNHEGELIDALQQCHYDRYDGIVINPGAYSHTSIALADALKSIDLPKIEVHISNISARESYRQHSLTAANCQGVISGLGLQGYHLAVQFLMQNL